jgi:hypothetical protein
MLARGKQMKRNLLALTFAFSASAIGCGDDDFGHERAASDPPMVVDAEEDLVSADLSTLPDMTVVQDLSQAADLVSTDGASDGGTD